MDKSQESKIHKLSTPSLYSHGKSLFNILIEDLQLSYSRSQQMNLKLII